MIARFAWLTLLLAAPAAAAEPLDLTAATVVAPPGLSGPEAKAVRMLVEEVETRSLVRWGRAEAWPADGPVIVVGPAAGVGKLLRAGGVPAPNDLGTGGKEGYQIGTSGRAVWVAGNDARGVLFGVGRLLRELRLDRLKVTLPANFSEKSAPRTPLRGHQIGYRPKTNSYDGWTVAMWEQYIHDLAVFGCNAVELIPPRSDDDADSPLFPLPPRRMMAEVSRIAGEYGLDVWVWYPAMDRDYTDPKTVAFALKEWGAVFAALPRLDAVFVPGGDPGHTAPTALFNLLEKQTANLHKYHPKAQMWVSAQSFNRERLDEMLGLLRKEPAWLSGVVHGPQVRVDLPEFRKLVPKRYPIRDYPDITHSRHCQYPVPDWDVAFALTIGREGCNPRPTQMSAIYRHAHPHTAGFITYSEGCHDDVNKVVWSALGWDERADVREVLRQYARYFVGPAFEERFADGLLALERNWVGPVSENAGIDETLELFQAMEKDAGPRQKLNWRFQQALYRAYYDAYVRARLRHEQAADAAALAELGKAKQGGSLKTMAEAEAILDRAAKEHPVADLRARVFELAEALFQSVRAQLSVKRYHAIAIERGANLDGIDAPLTDAAWLRKQIGAIRKLPNEADRLARLAALLTRTDPGPGGFYDDLGDPRRSPHLVRGRPYEDDPAFYESPFAGFSFRAAGPDPAHPKAWWQHAETLYDRPLRLRYPGLDPAARYRVRVVYPRERQGVKVRLMANGRHEVHGALARPFEPLEFDVPAEATVGGTLTLEWTQASGAGGTGRGCQVAEVWLLKR
ncbi:MAG TPA: hypothetical protein VFG68_00825 [Fimbriiglobus sp.]|nr:hypothetical protein [Fimbriiglobus sp.]